MKNGETSVRSRILEAAFAEFTKRGYAATSTLAIATRAQVSKRELYTQFGNKQEMLVTCISERAKRIRIATDLPAPNDREGLARTLEAVGAGLLREITDPAVIGIFRLAIAEAVRTPEIALALDSIGREASRTAVRETMAQAQLAGLLEGTPAEMAEQFLALVWGNLMVGLLLGVTQQPSPREITQLSREATTVFLLLHPTPDNVATRQPSGN